MIACAQCGYANPDTNKFCQYCGKALEILVPASPTIETLTEGLTIDPVDDRDEQSNSSENIAEFTEPEALGTHTNEQIEDKTENQTEIPIEEISPTQLEDNGIDLDLEDSNFLNTSSEDILKTDLQTDSENTLTVSLASLKYAGLTDVGRQRDHNEDTFVASQQVTLSQTPNQGLIEVTKSLFVVCDGMGGHAAGEVASAIATEKIIESFQRFWTSNSLPDEQTLHGIISTANQAIYELNEQELRRESGRMGTTLVLLATNDTEVAIAHVGDSRIYQITDSSITQITRDHEVANRLIDQGVDAEVALARPDAHQLTQALGPYTSTQIRPAIKFFRLTEPTLFLLCSDGLCDSDVVEQNWQTHLLPLLAKDSDLQAGVKDLIELGNQLNGHDNITAILINCQIETLNS